MKIYSTIHIGYFHTNHCEDFFIIEQLNSDSKLIAVMDGCTMGVESSFASALIGKVLRKIAKKAYYSEFIEKATIDLKTSLKNITKELFKELRLVKNQLDLDTHELLSTLILGVINQTNAEFITVGDGLIYHDGILVEYEQNDKPDYLGYHLSEDFDTWFNKQNQKLSLSNFNDISIATDGIYTFKNFENKAQQKSELEVIEYLLKDKESIEFDNFLDRKMRTLKDKWNHVVTDDIAIIRVKK